MYDFNKREEFDYTHSYDYLGGVGLGRSEVEAESLRKSKLGKYDMKPIDPPISGADEVIKIATLVSKSKEREKLLEKISSMRDPKLEFVWDAKHPNHAYYLWGLHCIDREVPNWTGIRSSPIRAKESSSVDKEILAVNDYVEISGIVARPELNEKVGKIIQIVPNNRYMVEFRDIFQTVSIASKNCKKRSHLLPTSSSILPRGLRVVICKLTSDAGKLLNGREGYVLTHEGERYTVRLDDMVKSLKADNLHVPVPPNWDERVDESTGKVFYVNQTNGATSWVHPVFSIVNEHNADDKSFDRDDFLRKESKRLKLDRKEKFRGMKESEIAAQLVEMRARWSCLPFTGTPRDLVALIHECDSCQNENGISKKTALLVVAFSVVLEDFKALKFNRSQLMALCAKMDEFEEAGKMTPDIEAWLVAALQIAIPNRYTIS